MTNKRLVDLNPRWVGAGGEGITLSNGQPAPERHGVAITFDCPCGCDVRAQIEFTIATDGKPWRDDAWTRTGDTFETLTLRPSIHRPARYGGCGWHGWLTNGELIPC
jgi:hypothetical protein